MEAWSARTRDHLNGAERIEASLVELVIALCETSEDTGEICDAMDDLIASGRIALQRI